MLTYSTSLNNSIHIFISSSYPNTSIVIKTMDELPLKEKIEAFCGLSNKEFIYE